MLARAGSWRSRVTAVPDAQGTALACLAVLAGMPPAAAIAWVRSNYHPWAVEGSGQEALVGRFAAWSGREPEST